MPSSSRSVAPDEDGDFEPSSQRVQEPISPEEPLGRSLESSSGKESNVSGLEDEDQNISPDGPQKHEETVGTQDAERHVSVEQAKQLQSSLLEIAESIELVKADHDKLEKQNLALQDYIGGLTRAMSKGQVPKGTKSSGK